MRTTLARVAVTLGALVSIALAGASSVSATEPTTPPDMLGLSIESVIYADEERGVSILNESSVEVAVTLTPSGDWKVTPDTLTLAPDELAEVTVTQVGTTDGTLAVSATGTAATPAGAQRSVILLNARLLQSRPFDPWPVIPWIVAASLLVALTVGGLVRRHRRALRERQWIEARIAGIRPA